MTEAANLVEASGFDMEREGLEPSTPALQRRCSPS